MGTIAERRNKDGSKTCEPEQEDQDRMVRAGEVVSLTGVSRRSLWCWEGEGEGKFSPHQKTGENATGPHQTGAALDWI